MSREAELSIIEIVAVNVWAVRGLRVCHTRRLADQAELDRLRRLELFGSAVPDGFFAIQCGTTTADWV
jgi:hypothetical protein